LASRVSRVVGEWDVSRVGQGNGRLRADPQVADHVHRASVAICTVLPVILLPAPTPTPLVTLAVVVAPTPSPTMTVVAAGSGQHDLFDWWSNIWIPAGGAVATIVVSLASLAVALLALRAAREANGMGRLQIEDARRRWRYDQLPALQAWFVDLVISDEPNPFEPKDAQRVAATQQVTRALESRADDKGIVLLEWLKWQVDPQKPDRVEDRQAVIDDGLRVMANWARDPALLDDQIIWPHCM